MHYYYVNLVRSAQWFVSIENNVTAISCRLFRINKLQHHILVAIWLDEEKPVVDPVYMERAFLMLMPKKCAMHRVQAHHFDLVFNWSDNLRI